MYSSRPSISAENEQAILLLLLPLLQPIGEFRRDHVSPSKGKGRGRRANKKTEQDTLPVWMPEVYDQLTIGFNCTVRRLEGLARRLMPQILSQTQAHDAKHAKDPGHNLSVVFVCRRTLPEIMTSTLPLLIATSAPTSTRAKLVDVSDEAEKKIARALHQPRVGVIGMELKTAGTEPLLRLLEENITPIDVPWLDQSSSPSYHPVKVHTVTTTPNSKPATQSRKRRRPTDGGGDTRASAKEDHRIKGMRTGTRSR